MGRSLREPLFNSLTCSDNHPKNPKTKYIYYFLGRKRIDYSGILLWKYPNRGEDGGECLIPKKNFNLINEQILNGYQYKFHINGISSNGIFSIK